MLITLHRIARASTWIAGAALVICSCLVAVEVMVRKAFNVSLGGVDEVTSYVFAIGVAWSFAYTLIARAHIRIDIVYGRLSRRWRSALDMGAMASLIVVTAMLVWQAALTALTSFELGARSNTPLGVTLWIPQALWVAGLAFFLLTMIALAVAAGLELRRGDHGRASALVGIRTLDEEIRDET